MTPVFDSKSVDLALSFISQAELASSGGHHFDTTPYKPDPTNYVDVIAPPPIFMPEFSDHLAEVALRISRIVAGVLPALFSGKPRAMLEWQGFPAEYWDLVEADCDGRGLLLGQSFSRPDMIVGPDGPRVLEVNFGPSNGSLALVDTIQRQLENTAFGRALSQAGIKLRPPTSMQALGRVLRQLLRRALPATVHNRVAIAVATEAEAKYPKGHILDFVRGLADLGYRATLVRIADLEARGDQLTYESVRIDAVFCMCTFAEILRADVPARLLRDLIRLDRTGAADFLGGPAHVLFDSKANLALLHDPIAERLRDGTVLPKDELDWARHIIPHTRLTAHPELRESSDVVIYKPVNDFGGNGISFDKPDINAAPHIAQHVVENTCLWFDHDGRRSLHLCFGPSIVGGTLASMVLRAKEAQHGIPIINVAQGAAVGPVLFRERE